MEPDDGQEDEGPLFAWLPPEDRLWRHPSEVGEPRPAAARTGTATRLWTVALLAGVVGAVLASGVGMATGVFAHRTVLEAVQTPTADTVDLTASDPGRNQVGDWPAIARELAPSVVTVSVADPSGPQTVSGVLYAAGHGRSFIITAADAVSGGGRLAVSFDNGRSEPAHLVGSDPTSGIALLWAEGIRQSFPPFGSVSGIQVADQVLAVGARSADNTGVVTGTVSGLDVRLDAEGGLTMFGMLAVSDVTIPEGSDGGALVDDTGAVVGIDTDFTSVDANQQGVAYAVPIDMAEHVAQELLDGRRPSHPWIGVEEAADISTATAHQLGVAGGAQVGAIAAGSPASQVGLAPDDVVTGFAGEPVTSSGALVMLLAQCQPDEHTTLTYAVGGQTRTVVVTVGSQPSFPNG